MAIIAMALVSSYYWACFPFDNLCETGTVSEFSGTWKLVGVAEAVSLDEEDVAYKYCIQDFFRFPRKEDAFPFIPKNQIKGSEWMTEDQEIIANIYGWSAIGVIFIIMLSIVWKWYLAFMTMFRGTYEPCGEDMGINFSDVPSMNSYVPEISSPVFAYPLLAANIDNIDTDLLDWTDPDRPHSYYDLTKDAEVLLRGKNFGNNIVFSQIAHWPPPGKEKKKKKKRKVN